jgi:L-cystine uptake protein TcyP (sodium:dicarboxylate symporter family)
MAFARFIALNHGSLAIMIIAVIIVVAVVVIIVKHDDRGSSLSRALLVGVLFMPVFGKALFWVVAALEHVASEVIAPSGVAVAVFLSLDLRGVTDVGGRRVRKD